MVVIPNQMVATAPGRQTISYYSYDPRSGNIVGVTEDGLNGSTDTMLYKELAKVLGEAVKNMKPPSSPIAYVHMYRGANTAAWNYCSYRLEGQEHEQAVISVVLGMDYWQKATNIMEDFGEAAGKIPFTNDSDMNSAMGGKLKEELSKMMEEVAPGVDDDWAKMAFKFGYLSTCFGLLKQLEGS
jgi:hypothetical protein